MPLSTIIIVLQDTTHSPLQQGLATKSNNDKPKLYDPNLKGVYSSKGATLVDVDTTAGLVVMIWADG